MRSEKDRELNTLWVCWSRPVVSPGPEAVVLSFLAPAEEDEFERVCSGCFLRAREASLGVRGQAKRLYVDLVARIGILRDRGGRTFRQALARLGQASRWWYHPVSFKDCEASPVFKHILAVLTIQSVARAQGFTRLILVSAPWEVAAVLREGYAVEEQGLTSPPNAMWNWLHGLGSRLRYLRNALALVRTARRAEAVMPTSRFEVVLLGFWDWSVRCKPGSPRLTDRYFKRLPEELRADGAASLGWLVWLDPWREPGQENRSLAEVMAHLWGRRDIVILQAFLRPLEVVAMLADLRPLLSFLRFRREYDWQTAFRVDDLNFLPLFDGPLLRGFLDCSLAHFEAVALATERAVMRLRPQVALTFLEHFLWSRAHYEGIHRSGIGTRTVAVQHASYNSEKTFLSLHPELEFLGEPDGYAIPHPDSVCAMGSLGSDLFRGCGYAADRVFVTGSPRYDQAITPRVERLTCPDTFQRRPRKILLALSLQTDIEIEMVEAMSQATDGLMGLTLVARNHPFSRIECHPRFVRLGSAVRLSDATLDDDLQLADLVVYTYSTVAEEAFLRGIPVWQWLPLDFNGSALAEIVTVPQYGSVAALRKALQAFLADPGQFRPMARDRRLVLERLFRSDDGRAASRIATLVIEILSGAASSPGLGFSPERETAAGGASVAPSMRDKVLARGA